MSTASVAMTVLAAMERAMVVATMIQGGSSGQELNHATWDNTGRHIIT